MKERIVILLLVLWLPNICFSNRFELQGHLKNAPDTYYVTVGYDVVENGKWQRRNDYCQPNKLIKQSNASFFDKKKQFTPTSHSKRWKSPAVKALRPVRGVFGLSPAPH